MSDFMHHPPPAESNGRSIRHFGDGFDRFRMLEQPERADGREAILPMTVLLKGEASLPGRLPIHGLSRHSCHREFGNMRVLRKKPQQAL